MSRQIADTRIRKTTPLVNPGTLAQEFPVDEDVASFIGDARDQVAAILRGDDPRVLAIVGPCSIHDPKALLEFAGKLKAREDSLKDAVYPVLRAYFEKPRTVIGWKGLINDPDLDGSFRVNHGLQLARGLLRQVAELRIAAATEFLDTTLGQYYADLISFGAIGARTVESQIHRELASGLSMPVGFKNATSGDVAVAIDAIRSAHESHWFPSLTHDGNPAILQASGNADSYLILRGGKDSGPNYSAPFVDAAAANMRDAGIEPGIIVDCSHGNSEKDPQRQPIVLSDVCAQLERGQNAIRGVMIESHLVAGSQSIGPREALVYGQSITDACLAWEDTQPLLEQLATAVRRSR
ncbi:MAG: 3-deoxy-7-phosphoheptulonate synthase [Pseudomonadota bacterium]